jgi:hypothetical protein
MIYTLFSSFIFLTGCLGLNEPLMFESKTQPVYLQAQDLQPSDRDQLISVLQSKGIVLINEHDFKGHRLVIKELRHQSRDLYDDPSSHNLYLTITSYLDTTLYDREREEILWEQEFKAQDSFKPSVHFYSDQAWAGAELVWNQQRILFNQLADELLKTCKKEPVLSGH